MPNIASRLKTEGMVKRKANPCWVNGPVAREIVEDPLVTEVVEESARNLVADSRFEEGTSAASTSEDTIQRLDEVVERGGDAAEVFWLLLELAGFTDW